MKLNEYLKQYVEAPGIDITSTHMVSPEDSTTEPLNMTFQFGNYSGRDEIASTMAKPGEYSVLKNGKYLVRLTDNIIQAILKAFEQVHKMKMDPSKYQGVKAGIQALKGGNITVHPGVEIEIDYATSSIKFV